MKKLDPQQRDAELDSGIEPVRKGKSKGERLFDQTVYGGLAGVGTFIATLYMANKFKNGSWAGPRYQAAVNGTKNFLGKFMSDSASGKVADEVVQTTSLMMGGNAMLIPIGIAEHYKVPIVNGLNTTLGDKTPPEAIEQAPKQTWGSLIEGRLLAWTAVFSTLTLASFAIPKSFQMYCHEVGERTHQFTRWAKRQPKLIGEAMKNTTSYRVGHIGALDVFATIAAATLLYVGGHFFARKHEQKKENRYARKYGMAEGARDEASEPTVTLNEAATNASAAPQVSGSKQHEGVLAKSPEVQVSA